MHEMTIAQAVLDSVLSVAREHGAQRVESVELACGRMRLVVPEAMRMAWEAATEGTPAEGSELTVSETPIRARCRACDRRFEPSLDDYLCPACGEADVEIMQGDDILVTSVTCTAEGEDEA